MSTEVTEVTEATEAKKSIYPPGLAQLFKPPLLLNESNREYQNLFKVFEEAMAPQNFMERILMKDVVDLTWEIVGAGKRKANLVNMTWKEATRTLLEALLTGDPVERRLEAQERAGAFFTDAGREWVVNFLRDHKLTIDAIAARANALRSPELEIIDRQMERARVSRMALTQDYMHHRTAGSWKAPKDLLAIVDASTNAIPLVPAPIRLQASHDPDQGPPEWWPTDSCRQSKKQP